MTRNENFPQLSELDAELFPSNNSDDTTFLYGEKPMTQKFDFNSLQAAEKQQSIDDHREYQEVLREIAGDRCTRSQAEILRFLERCDRDTGDLKADVDWRTERDTKIAELHREEEYRTKNAELLAKLQALREEFEKVEAEYQAKRTRAVEQELFLKRNYDLSGSPWDSSEARIDELECDAESMKIAVALAEWFKYEVRRVYSTWGGLADETPKPKGDPLQQKIVEFFEQNGKPITLREMKRKFRTESDGIGQTVQELVTQGILEQVQPERSRSGPRKEVYRLKK